MIRYLPLVPEGIGLYEVESLTSYLFRLADLHCMTRHQLQRHMWGSWFERTGSARRRWEVMRLNGYGGQAESAVTIVNACTRRGDLAGCTLDALTGVCAANVVGALLASRQWCVACLREDIARGRAPYDRLLWHLEVADRCPSHQAKLSKACHKCGSRQSIHDPIGQCCRRCGAIKWACDVGVEPSLRPFLGERQVCRLLEFTSGHPGFRFEESAVRRFASAIGPPVHDRSVAESIGDVFHARAHATRPRLTTLVVLAEFFECDLVELMLYPERAASQARLGFAVPTRSRRFPTRASKEALERCRMALDSALSSEGHTPSIKAFAKEHAVSVPRLKRYFPEQVAALQERRGHEIEDRRMRLGFRLADASVYANAYVRLGCFRSAKRTASDCAKLFDIPLHAARRMVAEAIARKRGCATTRG